MRYNKLVRDKIPDIIKKNGEIPLTHTASETEYKQKLYEKFQEEVGEFTENDSIDEMADVFEVITSIVALKGWTVEKVIDVQKKKTEERGSFKNKTILDETKK